MHICTSIQYKEQKMYVLIKDHVLWQSLFFWEDYFWDSIQKNQDEFKKMEDAHFTKEQLRLITKYLPEWVGKNMYGWGKLPLESLDLFTQNVVEKVGGISQEQLQKIQDKIRKYAPK